MIELLMCWTAIITRRVTLLLKMRLKSSKTLLSTKYQEHRCQKVEARRNQDPSKGKTHRIQGQKVIQDRRNGVLRSVSAMPLSSRRIFSLGRNSYARPKIRTFKSKTKRRLLTLCMVEAIRALSVYATRLQSKHRPLRTALKHTKTRTHRKSG